MKKQHLLLALGLAALTACTSEEIVQVGEQSNVIGFQNVINKNTRAVEGDLDQSSFNKFLVYGYYTKEGMSTPVQIFNGVEVNKENYTVDGKEKSRWTYNGVRYWIPKCTYYFYGYSCGDIALATGKGTPLLTLTNQSTEDGRALSILQYKCDGAHQHDLVTAESGIIIAKEKDNPAVSLPFTHALCKIKAAFTTDFPKEYKVVVSNVRLTAFFNYGDYNVGTQTWTDHKFDDAAVTNMKLDEDNHTVTNDGKSIETSEIFLIPKIYTNTEFAKIHFTIEVFKDDNLILQRDINGTWSPHWELGRIYKYNINISGSEAGIEPIVFATSQSLAGNTWDTSTEVKMEFGVDTND